MKLSELILRAKLADLSVQGDPSDVDITEFQLDSRLVQPGNLFAALPGTVVDGARFAASAVAKGASAILAQQGADLSDTGSAVVLRASDPSFALNQLCAVFYERQPKVRVAVTGTNGKTSVVNFLRQIWQSSGLSGASVGTLGVIPKGLVDVPPLTSPDAITLHRALDGLTKAGITHAALEASSHGLDQHRLHGLKFQAAGFTNFTQDHLDYHQTMEAYLAAKMRLFDDLLDGPAVINVDHTPTELWKALEDKGIKTFRLGLADNALGLDVSCRATPTKSGLSLDLRLPDAGFSGTVKMVGAYQAENIAMAAGLALASGLTSDSIVEAISRLVPAPGRMDWAASHPDGGPILVDYAHTPDALEAAISATRPHVKGRLIVVFGAGGDRDTSKRAPMGTIAARDADIPIVTDDNPRTEDPSAIRRQILAACPDGIEIGDRRTAIAHAIKMMQPGDGILIAGKGHESGQTVGEEVLPFLDLQVAQEEAAEVFGSI